MTSKKIEVVIGADTAPLKRGVVEAEGLFARLGKGVASLNAVAAESLSAVGGGMGLLSPAGAAVAITGAAAVGTAVLKLANDTAQTAVQFGKLAERSGLSVESFSKLAYAASLSGVSVEDLSRGMTGLSKKMAEAKNGSAEAQAVFKNLKIEYQEANGQLRPVEAVLLDLAEAFKQMPDGAEKAAIATKLMEEAGLSLIPVLNGGADAIKKWGEEAAKIGVVFTEEQIKAAKEYERNMKRLSAAASGVGRDIANSVIPALADLSTKLLENRGAGLGWFDSFVAMLTGSEDPAKRLQQLSAQLSILKDKQKELAAAGIAPDSGLDAKIASVEKAVAAYTQKVIDGAKKAETAEADSATKRGNLEQQLANKKIELARLVTFIQTGEGAKNEQAQKASTDRQIADQQRLVDAIRAAWQKSREEADKLNKSSEDRLTKAADARQLGRTTAENIRTSEMSPEDQVAVKQQRLQDIQGEASYEAARARMAAMEGDVKKYDSTASAAEKRLRDALQLAQEVKDATAAESIGNELAKLQEAGAALDKKRAQELTMTAEAQAKTLNDLQAKLLEMQQAARAIEVKLELGQLKQGIADVEADLAKLTAPRTIPLNIVTTTTAGQAPDVPAFASGGLLRGPGSGVSDSILARVSNGEYIVKAAAVNHYGANLLNRINNMQIPRFATGGHVGKPSGQSGSTVNLSLDGNRYSMSASADVAEALTQAIRREALRKGGRR